MKTIDLAANILELCAATPVSTAISAIAIAKILLDEREDAENKAAMDRQQKAYQAELELARK